MEINPHFCVDYFTYYTHEEGQVTQAVANAVLIWFRDVWDGRVEYISNIFIEEYLC